jgi:hypothetical protein
VTGLSILNEGMRIMAAFGKRLMNLICQSLLFIGLLPKKKKIAQEKIVKPIKPIVKIVPIPADKKRKNATTMKKNKPAPMLGVKKSPKND